MGVTTDVKDILDLVYNALVLSGGGVVMSVMSCGTVSRSDCINGALRSALAVFGLNMGSSLIRLACYGLADAGAQSLLTVRRYFGL